MIWMQQAPPTIRILNFDLPEQVLNSSQLNDDKFYRVPVKSGMHRKVCGNHLPDPEFRDQWDTRVMASTRWASFGTIRLEPGRNMIRMNHPDFMNALNQEKHGMTVQNENIISVEGLKVTYGRGVKKRTAVHELDFYVKQGETVGFIGPNGAGKSSTIKTMMGFVFPAHGHVTLFGEPAGTLGARRRTGYLPEVSLYYPFMKAREILELYGGMHGLPKQVLKKSIPELLERVGLAGRGEDLLKNFSKGMQQRIGIAQAIISDPDLFVFDELSSGLDPIGRYDLRTVLEDLKDRGKTIFFSSHELHEVESLCDRVIMINQGRKIEDTSVPELMKRLAGPSEHAGSLESYFMSLVRKDATTRTCEGQDVA
jgi:ABC-2 type transport system ATP-binding protein